MCLAIPGQIVEIVDELHHLAKVDVAGVLRNVNVGLLQDVGEGDWVLIHVGFALSQIDEKEAQETFAFIKGMGDQLDEEMRMMEESARLKSFEV